jgi:hypothetical protein
MKARNRVFGDRLRDDNGRVWTALPEQWATEKVVSAMLQEELRVPL